MRRPWDLRRRPDHDGDTGHGVALHDPVDAPARRDGVDGAGPLDEAGSASLGDLTVAAEAESDASSEHRFGLPGPPLDRRSPFVIGFLAAFGVAAAFVVVYSVYAARGLLTEIGLGLFIALGLDPIVSWLERRGLRRGWAVLIVVLAALGALGGIAAQVVPVLTDQVSNLVANLPHYEKLLTAHNSFVGKLNTKYKIVTSIQNYVNQNGSKLATGFIGVGKAVLSGVLETIVVVIVSIYTLVDLPRIKRTIYSLSPRRRRARVVLLGEQMFTKVGAYVIGNVTISLLAGVGTWAWAFAFGIPYPLLLATVVAVLDLIPLVGSTIGGVIVALVALTVSLPVAVATLAFYLLFRVFEDYILTPKVMGATVKVPGIVTVLATLFGGALLGVIGALIAIPIAAAVLLLVDEITMPTMNRR